MFLHFLRQLIDLHGALIYSDFKNATKHNISRRTKKENKITREKKKVYEVMYRHTLCPCVRTCYI